MKRFLMLTSFSSLLLFLVASFPAHAQIPTAPTDLRAADGTSADHVSLMWTSRYSGEDTTFTIYRAENETDTPVELAVVESSRRLHLDRSAVLNTVYYYWIEVTYNGVTSRLSKPDSGFSAVPIPPTITPTPAPSSTPEPPILDGDSCENPNRLFIDEEPAAYNVHANQDVDYFVVDLIEDALYRVSVQLTDGSGEADRYLKMNIGSTCTIETLCHFCVQVFTAPYSGEHIIIVQYSDSEYDNKTQYIIQVDDVTVENAGLIAPLAVTTTYTSANSNHFYLFTGVMVVVLLSVIVRVQRKIEIKRLLTVCLFFFFTPLWLVTQSVSAQTLEPPPTTPCSDSRIVEPDRVQHGVDVSTAEPVWFSFDVVTDTTYILELYVPMTATADITLSIYDTCDDEPLDTYGRDYTYHARLSHYARTAGTRYIKIENSVPALSTLSNEDGFVWLSIRPLTNDVPGGAAIIVVAETQSEMSQQLHRTGDNLYRYFTSHAYADDRIYYMAADIGRDPTGDTLSDVDAIPALRNLELAITGWAKSRLRLGDPLTIALIGDDGRAFSFSAESGTDDTLTIDTFSVWLEDIEAYLTDIPINIIVESSQAGEFLSLSAPNRTLILATHDTAAHTSKTGAFFTEHWLTGLRQEMNWSAAYRFAQSATTTTYPTQQPLLDANGNGVGNEAADYDTLATQEFNFTGIFGGALWQPVITGIEIDPDIEIDIIEDYEMREVWAMVHPLTPTTALTAPHHIAPTPRITLTQTSTTTWSIPFTPTEQSRVTIHAQDFDTLLAQPVSFTTDMPTPAAIPLAITHHSTSPIALNPLPLFVALMVLFLSVAMFWVHTHPIVNPFSESFSA